MEAVFGRQVPLTAKHPPERFTPLTAVVVPPESARYPPTLRLVVVAEVPVAVVKKSAVAVRAVVEA